MKKQRKKKRKQNNKTNLEDETRITHHKHDGMRFLKFEFHTRNGN